MHGAQTAALALVAVLSAVDVAAHPCDTLASSITVPSSGIRTFQFCVPAKPDIAGTTFQAMAFCRVFVNGAETWNGPVAPIGPRSSENLDLYQVTLDWSQIRRSVIDLWPPAVYTVDFTCGLSWATAYTSAPARSLSVTVLTNAAPVPSQAPTNVRKGGSGGSGAMRLVWEIISVTGPIQPGFTGQIRPHYDALSDRVWFPFQELNSSDIYASSYFAIDKNGGAVRLSGTGTIPRNCSRYPIPSGIMFWNDGSGAPIQPWPPDGHKDNQSANDGQRIWQWSNLACENRPEGDGIGYNTLFYLTLNANPTLARWTKVTGFQTPLVQYGGSLAYNAKNNVLVLHGFGGAIRTYLYFPSASSTCSAAQLAAGCVRANDWLEVYTNGIADFAGGQSYNALLFDEPETDRVLLFGNYCDGGTVGCTTIPWRTQVWAFDVRSHAWTPRSQVNAPLNQASTQFDTSLAPITIGTYAGCVHYHRNSHQNIDTGQARDFLYCSAADQWTDLGVQLGVGPQKFTWEVFVPTIGTKGGFLAMEATSVGQPIKLWRATIQ